MRCLYPVSGPWKLKHLLINHPPQTVKRFGESAGNWIQEYKPCNHSLDGESNFKIFSSMGCLRGGAMFSRYASGARIPGPSSEDMDPDWLRDAEATFGELVGVAI